MLLNRITASSSELLNAVNCLLATRVASTESDADENTMCSKATRKFSVHRPPSAGVSGHVQAPTALWDTTHSAHVIA